MTRVFDGERTSLRPVLRPIERAFTGCPASTRTKEQHWVTYAVAMLAFSLAGFVMLYALQRFQAVLPFNPQGRTRSRPTSRSTRRSASSPTPTGSPTCGKPR